MRSLAIKEYLHPGKLLKTLSKFVNCAENHPAQEC
jgi:hypothetical protein